MFQARVSMVVRKISAETSIIAIEGDVNRYSENALMEAYSRASEGGTRNILLDFNRMEYMNSSGIGLLVTLLVRIQRQGQRLIAFGLDEHYHQIFDLTRLNQTIKVFPDEETALSAVMDKI